VTVREPAQWIISGVDGDGNAVPVCAEVTCSGEEGSFVSVLPLSAVHGFRRNQQEEGYTVTVDWLYEVPAEFTPVWAALIIEQGGHGRVDFH
jgi:hypothetical protein